MKKVVFVTFSYEESGGTKTVINDLYDYYSARGFNAEIIIVNLPVSRSLDMQGRNKRYLNSTSNFSLTGTISQLSAILIDAGISLCFFISGNPLIPFLCLSQPVFILQKSLLFFLDPWFTFSDLNFLTREKVSKFIAVRDNMYVKHENNLYTMFTKLGALNKQINEEFSLARTYEHLRGVLVCSTDMVDYFVKIGIIKDKILYSPLYLKLSVSQKLHRKVSDNLFSTFIYTGRVSSSWKGFGVVLEALQKKKDFMLNVYTWDTDEVELLNKFLLAYNVDPSRVRAIQGYTTEQLMAVMPKVCGVLIPSVAEGFSFTMLESMYAGGITIMGAMFGGPKDVIRDGYNGFTFVAGDSDSLVSAINNAIEYTLSKDQLIFQNARKTALSYTFENYIARIEKKFTIK